MSPRTARRNSEHKQTTHRDNLETIPQREISGREVSRRDASRRDFLKLFQAGLLGAFLLPLGEQAARKTPLLDLDSTLPRPPQGRVAYERVGVYQAPSFSSPEVASHWQDTVLSIQDYVLGDEEPAYNRVWYRLGDHKYVHSGGVQPVETRPNPPSAEIPASGRLAEVTVPFSDAYWGPGLNFPIAYRFYYATTHWVTGLVRGDDGQDWYRLVDDKWEFEFFVYARHLRLVPPEELSPLSPTLPLGAKKLVVNREQQTVTGYEWNRPVFIARAATGAKFSNGDFSTPLGYHITSAKRATRHMAAGNLAYNGYDLPGVPWVTYFTQSGISFHGTYWHNNYGKPRSHGCVNLSPQAALWIYRWTLPVVPPESPELTETYGTGVWVV